MQVNRATTKCGFQKTWRLEHLVRNLYADALRTAPIRRDFHTWPLFARASAHEATDMHSRPGTWAKTCRD